MPLGNIEVNITVSGTVTSTQGNITVRRVVEIDSTDQFANGTGALQSEDAASVSGSVTTTPTDLDLEALAGGAGNINFDELRVFVVENTDTSGSAYLLVGGGGSNEWLGLFDAAGDALRLPAGSLIAFKSTLANGLAVASGSKTLRLNASTGTVTYKVTCIGTST